MGAAVGAVGVVVVAWRVLGVGAVPSAVDGPWSLHKPRIAAVGVVAAMVFLVEKVKGRAGWAEQSGGVRVGRKVRLELGLLDERSLAELVGALVLPRAAELLGVGPLEALAIGLGP